VQAWEHRRRAQHLQRPPPRVLQDLRGVLSALDGARWSVFSLQVTSRGVGCGVCGGSR